MKNRSNFEIYKELNKYSDSYLHYIQSEMKEHQLIEPRVFKFAPELICTSISNDPPDISIDSTIFVLVNHGDASLLIALIQDLLEFRETQR